MKELRDYERTRLSGSVTNRRWITIIFSIQVAGRTIITWLFILKTRPKKSPRLNNIMALSMDESWLFVPSKNDKNCTIIDIYSSLIRTNIDSVNFCNDNNGEKLGKLVITVYSYKCLPRFKFFYLYIMLTSTNDTFQLNINIIATSYQTTIK